MLFLNPCLLLFAATSLLHDVHALQPGSKVKLSKVQSLTLRKGLKTSHRRVSAVPQLKCIGGPAKGLYDIDVMRCKNAGSDYDDENIQWTCTASLPEEFKLGSTDVICEGYDYRDDPYILKGSCGVEYRLALTDLGEEKYGKKKHWYGHGDDKARHPNAPGGTAAVVLFWLVFTGVALWILSNMLADFIARRRGIAGIGERLGWGRGGGGGGGGDGGGGWGGADDPPPPYDPNPPSNQNNKRTYGTNTQAGRGWRPGVWTGAAAGAAAGYMAGSRNSNRQSSSWMNDRSGLNAGGGSSRSSSSSGSPSYSSTRHESTGFGSTSRR